MDFKYKIFLFATTFAIVFTMLIYLIPKYKMLWFSLEVIILPLIYYVGYEMMMDQQKEEFERSVDFISSKIIDLDDENKGLKLKLKYLKRKK